ncbi:Swt1 family HEPN domain-containing protein [Planctomicrobium sp. SH664]|uniref:Swt1 family HEPN domain-containing protein n=1 Tax=Planctomicrobium sp. SH664 TaxID=3448125 RepID=UPI003F5C283F
MAAYRERVSTAMDLLTAGLTPYVETKLRSALQDNWTKAVVSAFRDDRNRVNGDKVDWDAQALLTVMWDQWNAIFRDDLGHFERSLVSELREVRNRWAHQHEFNFDDAFRVLDSVDRLLSSVRAPNVATVKHEKSDLLESHVAEAVNTQVQKTAFQRNKWWIIAIYTLCCGLIVGHSLFDGGNGNAALGSIVLLVFIYLIYQQFKMEPPLLYGPRECPRCHRIVYRKICPYCSSGET